MAKVPPDVARRLQRDSQPCGKVFRDNLEIGFWIVHELREIPDNPKCFPVVAGRPENIEFLALGFG